VTSLTLAEALSDFVMNCSRTGRCLSLTSISVVPPMIQRLAGGALGGDTAAIEMRVPTVGLYIALRRYFVQGTASVGVKG
jgi:hypothetical protein